MLREFASFEREHFVDFEAAERWIIDSGWAGEVCGAGGEGVEVVFGGERAGEAGSGDGGVDVEEVAVGVRGDWNGLVRMTCDGAMHRLGAGDGPARWCSNDCCAVFAARCCEGAVPGDELFALAVAADPFKFARLLPMTRDLCGR